MNVYISSVVIPKRMSESWVWISAYKNIGPIKVHACTAILVGVHIVFISLFVNIVWI